MEGRTHQIIGPIFTVGASTYYMSIKHAGFTFNPVFITAIAVVVSYFSATWPDADQTSKSKPLPVILYGIKPFAPYYLGAGVRYKNVTLKNGKKGKRLVYKGEIYTKAKRIDMKLWAAFFRIIGARKHRCFLTHGPLLWVPLWCLLCNLVTNADVYGILSGIIQGCAFGYLSHILADAFTVGCVPFLPDFELIQRIPVIGSIYHWIANFKIFRWGAFTASNKVWNYTVIFIILDAVLFFAFPEVGRPLNQGIKDFALMIGAAAFDGVKSILTKS